MKEDAAIDLVYAAALEPERWGEAITAVTDLARGSSAWLSQVDAKDGSGGDLDDPMARIAPEWPMAYQRHFHACNPLNNVDDPSEFLRSWRPKIVLDEEWMPKDDLRRTEFYNDFLLPQRVRSCAMIRLAVFGRRTAVLNVNCGESRSEFEADDLAALRRLHPHLIRAFNMTGNLGGLRKDRLDLATAMEISAQPLIFVSADGVIQRVNAAAEALLERGQTLRSVGGRLVAATQGLSRGLHALIARAGCADAEERAGGSLKLEAADGGHPLLVTLSPARPERLSRFDGEPSVLLAIADPAGGAPQPDGALRLLYDLTAAEARLAGAIFQGDSLKEAATRFGLSQHTVHNQLARVFAKTGVGRQAELVRLMSGLANSHVQSD